jgi:hypothetical protein
VNVGSTRKIDGYLEIVCTIMGRKTTGIAATAARVLSVT